MDVLVREYQAADRLACVELFRELAQHHATIFEDPEIAKAFSEKYVDEYFQRADYCGTWVAVADGKVVGIAGLLLTNETPKGGEIEPVIVNHTMRSQGIGTKLIERAVKEAKKCGVRFLWISPVARNAGAIALYTRLGFDIIGNIQMVQDLDSTSTRKWKSGLVIHGQQLRY